MTMYPDLNEPLLGPENLPWSEYDLGTLDRDGRLPEALIVAPGLGSRIFMASALTRHPGIELIAPEFFTWHWACHELSWYSDHVKKHAGKTVIDASESLVFLPNFAIEKIKALKPDLQIIIILQNPWSLCLEFIQNRFFYQKGVFANRDLYLDDVPDSILTECLIRDDLMTRIDYEALVRRWTSVFPASRVIVRYLENTAESSAACVNSMFDFITHGEAFEDRSESVFQPLSYGNGLHLDRPLVKDMMDDIIYEKFKSFHPFLESNNRPVSPWIFQTKSGTTAPVYVEKRKNWRIYMNGGAFQGVHDVSDEVLDAGFLEDIRRLIHGDDRETKAKLPSEDARLCSILNETAQNSIRDKQKTERMNTLRFVEDYNLYNILKSGDKYIALRQSLGQVALLREKLGEREMAPHILNAQTCDAVKMKIDKIQDENKPSGIQQRIVDRWF